MWPEAVEAILADHPAVAEVMVRGVDDDEWGQIVEAVVVPGRRRRRRSTASATHVKVAHPAFMAPRSLVIVDALPRTALGKLRRSTTA